MRFLFLLAAFLVVGKTALSQRTSSQADNLIPQDEGEKRVVCYYTNWSVYRQGRAKFTPQNINPYLCTHLVYAFGGLTDEFEVSTFDSYQDIEQGGYAKFNGLKQYNKNMKTLLAIGGWNEGSSRFSELVSLKEYRDNFTLSAIKHLRRYNFDGLDLDWEYPGSRDGSAPEDKENYALLVKELREAFELERTKSNKWRLLLTMAVPAGQVTIDKGFDVPTLNKYLDFINLLTYDYHSVYEPSVNHHSALFAPPGTSEYELNAQLNVDWTIKYYISKGASKNKLVLGIPTYGRSYTLLDGGFYGFGSSADGPGTKGNDTNEKGYLAFYEICEAVALEEWTVKKPFPKRMGPFAFKGNQWVGYDDEKIAAKKAEYVSENGLGGIMFWAIDSDDFRGVCNGEKYPLVEAAKRALFASSKPSGNKVTEPDQLTDSSPGRRKQPNKQGQRRLPNSKPDVDIHPLSTPEPPSTPSSIKGFNCKKQGFFPHPDSCNQYYWCLDSGASGLGIVAHGFTCPSNLIFNKKIDGCDHPDRVKCKVGAAGRGGSKSDPTTTPIPTTTEFDYTLIQDFDYYYDYEEPLIEPVEEKAIDIKIEQPIEENVILPKNSGGPQFEVSSITDTKDEISQKSQIHSFKDPTDRTRPGYSSIQRERPKVRDQPINVDQEIIITEVEDIQSNRPNRPQYVTLNRQSSSDSLVPEDKNLFDALNIDTTTEKDALEYVTINRRRRPTVTPVSLLEEEAVTKLGPEYVTLHRLRPVTTATETPLSSPLDFDPVAENPSETLFEEIVTTTTTTEKPTKRPRIRIPSVLRSSGPSPRPAQTHRRRPERTRSRSQVEEIKEAVPEEIKFERPLQRENKDTEAVIPEEKLGSNRQRNRFQKRPRLRQRPVIHEEKVLQDTNTAATIEIAHEKLQDLTNEATDLTEKDSIQVKLEEEIQTQEVVSQKKKEAHPQREEVLTHSNKEVIIKENIPDEIKDEGAINIKEEKLNDQEKQVGEEKAAQSKTSDNLETILEEIEASLDAGESPVEEAFLLFQQNAKNSTVDSNQTESIARHEALEIITSTSTAIIDTTKATTQNETSTIPVSHNLRPLLVRSSNSSSTISPVEKSSSLSHAEDDNVLAHGLLVSSENETFFSPSDMHSRVMGITLHSHTTENTLNDMNITDKSVNDTLPRDSSIINEVDINEMINLLDTHKQFTASTTNGDNKKEDNITLQEIYQKINNHSLDIQSHRENLNSPTPDSDDIAFLFTKLAEIDLNLQSINKVLLALQPESDPDSPINQSNTPITMEFQEQSVSHSHVTTDLTNESDNVSDKNSKNNQPMVSFVNNSNENTEAFNSSKTSQDIIEQKMANNFLVPDLKEVNSSRESLMGKKILKTRVEASPVRVVIGDYDYEYPDYSVITTDEFQTDINSDSAVNLNETFVSTQNLASLDNIKNKIIITPPESSDFSLNSSLNEINKRRSKELLQDSNLKSTFAISNISPNLFNTLSEKQKILTNEKENIIANLKSISVEPTRSEILDSSNRLMKELSIKTQEATALSNYSVGNIDQTFDDAVTLQPTTLTLEQPVTNTPKYALPTVNPGKKVVPSIKPVIVNEILDVKLDSNINFSFGAKHTLPNSNAPIASLISETESHDKNVMPGNIANIIAKNGNENSKNSLSNVDDGGIDNINNEFNLTKLSIHQENENFPDYSYRDFDYNSEQFHTEKTNLNHRDNIELLQTSLDEQTNKNILNNQSVKSEIVNDDFVPYGTRESVHLSAAKPLNPTIILPNIVETIEHTSTPTSIQSNNNAFVNKEIGSSSQPKGNNVNSLHASDMVAHSFPALAPSDIINDSVILLQHSSHDPFPVPKDFLNEGNLSEKGDLLTFDYDYLYDDEVHNSNLPSTIPNKLNINDSNKSSSHPQTPTQLLSTSTTMQILIGSTDLSTDNPREATKIETEAISSKIQSLTLEPLSQQDFIGGQHHFPELEEKIESHSLSTLSPIIANNKRRGRPSIQKPSRGSGRIVVKKKILGAITDTPVNIVTIPFARGDGQLLIF